MTRLAATALILATLGLTSVDTRAEQTRVALVYTKATRVGYDVQLTNNGNVPLTATIIASAHPGHRGAVDNSFHMTDAVYQWPNNKPLAPGQSLTINVGPSGAPGSEAIDIKLVAAVFADGTSEGEPEWISRIVGQRKKALVDLIEALAILRASVGQGNPRELLLTTFQEFRSRNLASLPPQPGNFFERAAAERVPATVLLNLEKKLLPAQSSADAQEALQSTIDFLETWFRELQSSQPSL